MCGIAGIVNFNNELVATKSILQMISSLGHRGPDGEGIWTEKNIAFGHRRLSIIDLSENAQQPMLSSCERYVLTYNGEVYNYKEIRIKLESKGYKFVSTSDTEVVLYSIIEWGELAIEFFNGMFSLAFFDRKTGKLLLARDRYGLKPLYYSRKSSRFLFASEQKGILSVFNGAREIDVQGLIQYLTFQNILSNHTLLQDIRLLEPGHVMTVCTLTGRISKRQFWDFNFSNNIQGDSRELGEELQRLFEQAVRRMLVSDVEIGSYLSGGMDSASIAAIASKLLSGFKTFTCGFDLSSASGLELGFDERSKAEAVSNFIKSEQYEMVLKSGDMERCFPDLVNAIEEPRVGQSYPNFYAAKLASKFVKVVLSGAGGDEIFGGYPWRYFQGVGARNYEDYALQYYSYWQRMLEQDELLRLCKPISRAAKDVDTFEVFKNILDKGCNGDDISNFGINYSLYFEAKTFLHGLLVVEDKLSMSHSLETRLPFLDNDLVDFGMAVHVNEKIRNLKALRRMNENDLQQKFKKNIQKSNDGKSLLRRAMTKYLPDDVLSSDKQGFSGPDASWFRGESIDFVKDSLSKPDAAMYDFLDYEFTQKLLSEHLSGAKNRRLLVWSLISLNKYIEKVI